ncbi:hypothetical protein OSTOST_10225, partial [Ostertagia ostertagi]
MDECLAPIAASGLRAPSRNLCFCCGEASEYVTDVVRGASRTGAYRVSITLPERKRMQRKSRVMASGAIRPFLRCTSKVRVWTKNMREFGEPIIVEDPKAMDGTRVTFRPDLAKFGIAGLDDAICRMFRKRTYDVAGTLRNVSVYYNGELVE